jgi:aconitate hydratase
MGILPLVFRNGETATKLGLNGKEKYSILIDDSLNLRQTVDVMVDNKFKFQVEACIYDQSELLYFKNSGLLNYFTRKYL